jgi:hypothetical protein
MESDKETMETLRHDFLVLNETNRRKVVDMTKFLVLTQDTIIPGFLEEKNLCDMSLETEKEK